MGASILRSAARHRPAAVHALLCSAATDTSAALVRPAPAARRQLCDSAVAKMAASEVERVETASSARYDATARSMQALTSKVTNLTATLHKKETDAALDLTRTSAKVCALVSLSAAALGGFSYIAIMPPGSAPPAATEEVDKGMEEVKTRLQGKISEWYEDEEAKARAKAVSNSKPGTVSKLKSVSISKPKSKIGSATSSAPGSGSNS
ncbi:hypothetical protein VPH35_130847 [Triticum aestivum]